MSMHQKDNKNLYPVRLRVYNTLTGRIEDFRPIKGNRVNMFVCGPTVYDFPHLGHAKTYTQFDFIARYLRHIGFDVFYLQNITDIDDKIIDRARAREISWKELTQQFEEAYREDMIALHNNSVDKYARATEHIDQIVRQVELLLDKDYAYHTSDGIYYEINKFHNYGKLSGRTELREEDSVSRIDESNQKRGWNDFCLWKAPKYGDPIWETKIGPGRPGWHIEDTAITEEYFGSQYDLHGGAIDLIFPHHEAEIAQMEAISGKRPLVRYWLHTGFLNIESKKMSKSLGNFKTIREALELYDYRTIRFLFISNQYRKTLNFNEDMLEQAKSAVRRLDEFLFNVDKDYEDDDCMEAVEQLKNTVYEALDNDFNTPQAFAAIFDFIRTQNKQGKPGRRIFAFFRELNNLFDVMSINQISSDEDIQLLIEKREAYRANKDFAKADEIRTQLYEMDIQIYDSPEGTKWRRI